jgi:hypothetical protein
MALDEEMKEDEGQETLTDEEEDDLRIAVNIAKNFIDQGGIDVVDKAVSSSKDPGQVIGQFLMQAAREITKNLPEGVTLSPRIWLARGGVLEEVSDYLQDEYDIDSEIMDRAEMYVASALQAQAQQEQQGAPQQAAPQAGPPALPGAM